MLPCEVAHVEIYMAHLVAPPSGPLPLAEAAAQLQAAHDYLARQGAQAIDRALVSRDIPHWGAAIKRIPVELPAEDRPTLIAPAIARHSLIEVINQCATMERLLDALAWAQTPEAGLGVDTVVSCHPTTSSAKGAERADNDLILTGPDGRIARFEVSDVASEEDGNQKERRDLISLGVLRDARGPARFDVTWPAGRLFLVVSQEFATRLERPTRAWLKGNPPYCSYQPRLNVGGTRIVEVLSGAAPSNTNA